MALGFHTLSQVSDQRCYPGVWVQPFHSCWSMKEQSSRQSISLRERKSSNNFNAVGRKEESTRIKTASKASDLSMRKFVAWITNSRTCAASFVSLFLSTKSFNFQIWWFYPQKTPWSGSTCSSSTSAVRPVKDKVSCPKVGWNSEFEVAETWFFYKRICFDGKKSIELIFLWQKIETFVPRRRSLAQTRSVCRLTASSSIACRFQSLK